MSYTDTTAGVSQIFSQESEMMVLGSVLTSEDGLKVATESLNESDFHLPMHRTIFKAAQRLHASSKRVDVHVVAEELRAAGTLDVVGVSYLTELANFVGTSPHVEEYCRIVLDKAVRRQMQSAAFDGTKDISTAVERIQQRLLSTSHDHSKSSPNIDVRSIEERARAGGVHLLNSDPKPMPTLIYEPGGQDSIFLRRGIVGMVVGAGGVGKTHLLAQLAVSITTGSEWLGKFPIPASARKNVFLGLGENDDEDIHRLLKKVSNGLDPEMRCSASSQIYPHSFSATNSTFSDRSGNCSRFFKVLKANLEKVGHGNGGWSLIVLDPASRFLGADAETDSAAATEFISMAEQLTKLPGLPTVLLGHHMSKVALSAKTTDQTAARGSSALTDGVRWQANLEWITDGASKIIKSDEVCLKVVKSNFTSISSGPYTLQKGPNGILRCTSGTPVPRAKR